MKVNRFRWAVFAIIFLFILELPIFADELYNIKVYKAINRDQSLKDEKLNSEGYVPIVGSPIEIYKAENLSKSEWDKRDFSKLTPLMKKLTDSEGAVVFENLSAGSYYVRDASTKGYIAQSVIVSVPAYKDGQKLKELVVRLKSEKDIPPETPPSEPPRKRIFLKIDRDTKEPLFGASFKVFYENEKKELVPVIYNGSELILTSDIRGHFEVKDLKSGTYYLIETSAPEKSGIKYKVLPHPLKFTIDDNSIFLDPIVIEDAPGEPPKNPPGERTEIPPKNPPKDYTVPPKNPHLSPPPEGTPPKPGINVPKTGDVQMLYYLIGGGFLTLVGLYNYRYGIKKRRVKSHIKEA